MTEMLPDPGTFRGECIASDRASAAEVALLTSVPVTTVVRPPLVRSLVTEVMVPMILLSVDVLLSRDSSVDELRT